MLTEPEVRFVLSQVLASEECDGGPNWLEVGALSASLLDELPKASPEIVHSYLTDADKRRTDPTFAFAQRSELLRFLRS